MTGELIFKCNLINLNLKTDIWFGCWKSISIFETLLVF